MSSLNAVTTIAYRDTLKFLRDRTRILATFIFPAVFIGILGGSFQSSFGDEVGFNYLTFVFTGIVAQTLFQSAASGIISLIEDRENDFSQELFVSPVSRYVIIIGKIIGESVVAYLQVIGVVLFSLIIGVPISVNQLLILVPVGIAVCMFGGAFGVLVMSQLSNVRAANQIFPFLIFPQFFLAGIFNPVTNLPVYLLILSRLAPMTYAVDLIRGVYYWGDPMYSELIIFDPWIDLGIIVLLFVAMLVAGTYFFIRNERER